MSDRRSLRYIRCIDVPWALLGALRLDLQPPVRGPTHRSSLRGSGWVNEFQVDENGRHGQDDRPSLLWHKRQLSLMLTLT